MSDDACDTSAEQALLGSMLLDPDAAAAAFRAVPDYAWWLPLHASIAAVITARLGKDQAVDPQLVLSDLLNRQGIDSKIGPYLITLTQRAWAPWNAQFYADRVLHCAARRKLSAAATHVRQRLEQSWRNGYGEPISDFTTGLREAIELAEQTDAGVEAEEPSLTLTDLLATRDEHDWLVPGLLERGERIILTGTEGLGKSYLISQFAVCLAAGLHPFSGNLLGQGRHHLRVLVVDCENGVSQTRRRFQRITTGLRGLGGGWQDNLRLEVKPNGLNLLGPDVGWLERKVAINQPDLLVLGPLYRLHYANMNDETAARELVRVIDGLRTRYGCALLTEAHPGHAEDGQGERRMRPAGSSLFLRWPEFGYGLRRAKEAEGEHPDLVDVVAWRGSREERAWPKQLRHGDHLPWAPADPNYGLEAVA